MDDPVKPKIVFNHHTLTTKFLDARHLKQLKNNLKSLGIKNKQLNHYLLTTYEIINDLESAQAEYRRPKQVRAADKEYVNTVEFVRLVAEIVAGHILNAVCGGREDSPKADDDSGLAKRLLEEISSQFETADGGTSEQHTHGDHIRLGVANAVAEILTAAKATGGLPGMEHAVKTTSLSAKAEAERRRRGALAARLLASGKLNYDYCDSGKSNPRVQASRNKRFPKFERRTNAAAVDEGHTSSDGVKSGADPKAMNKVSGRSKPNISLPDEKDQGTASTQDAARRVQIEKTIGSRTSQRRPANVIRTNYGPKVPDARKTVDESHMSDKNKNVNATVNKSRDRIPRQPVVGDDVVNNVKSRQRGDTVHGRVTIHLPKDVSRRKQATAGESKTVALVRTGTGKSKSNAVEQTSDIRNSKVRWTATTKDNRKKFADPVSAKTSNKLRKSRPTGVLPRELKTSGLRRKPTLTDIEGRDNKHEKSLNGKGTVLGDSNVVEKSKSPRKINGDAAMEKSKASRTKNGGATVEKSKTSRKKNGDAVVEKPKISGTKNGGATVEKSKTLRTKNGDADMEKSKISGIRNGDAVVEKPKITGTKNGGATVEKSKTLRTKNGDTDMEKSKISGIRNGDAVVEKPKITGTKNGRATVEKSKTSRTKTGYSVVEKPKDTRTGNDVGKPGRGEKMNNLMTPPSENLISPAIDYHEDASLTAARDGINEPIETKRTVTETINGPRTRVDERDDGGGKNALNPVTRKGIDFDEQDTVKTNEDSVESKRDQVENRADKPKSVANNTQTGEGNAETGTNNAKIGQNNVETGRNRVDERDQEETGHKTTTSMATNRADSCDTGDICNDDDDIYKLRKNDVLGLSNQSQNQVQMTNGRY